MKAKLIILSLVLIPFHAAAESDIESALAGCAAIKNSKQKASCYEAVTKLAAQAKTSQAAVVVPEPPKPSAAELEKERIAAIRKKFEPANRAATAIKAATDVGVNYNQYGQYIQQLATELAIVGKDANTENERNAIRSFESAIEAYKDAGAFWETCIRFYSHRDNNMAYGWGLPLGLTRMEWFASKYNISTHKADLLGFHAGITQAEGLSAAWGTAANLVENANSELNKSRVSTNQAAAPKKADSNNTTINPNFESIEASADALIHITNAKMDMEQYNSFLSEMENEFAKVRAIATKKYEISAIYNFDQAIKAYKEALPLLQNCTGNNAACETPELRKKWEYAEAYIANAKIDLRKPDN